MTDWKVFFDGILTERDIKINEPMSRHTTYGIGGPADVFVMPQTEEQLIEILRKADAEGIAVTVIGGGSNTLVSDKGIRGITICMNRMKQEMASSIAKVSVPCGDRRTTSTSPCMDASSLPRL